MLHISDVARHPRLTLHRGKVNPKYDTLKMSIPLQKSMSFKYEPSLKLYPEPLNPKS